MEGERAMSDEQVLHFFGGKGGAGKTTLSTAFAINLSDRLGKDRVLLGSIEPNGGLAGLVKKKLSGKPTKLQAGKGVGGLWAVELEQSVLAEEWNKGYRAALQASAVKGVILDEGDVAKLLLAGTSSFGEPAAMFHLLDLL